MNTWRIRIGLLNNDEKKFHATEISLRSRTHKTAVACFANTRLFCPGTCKDKILEAIYWVQMVYQNT